MSARRGGVEGVVDVLRAAWGLPVTDGREATPPPAQSDPVAEERAPETVVSDARASLGRQGARGPMHGRETRR